MLEEQRLRHRHGRQDFRRLCRRLRRECLAPRHRHGVHSTALTYPEIGKIQYTSARGDASKAISDLRSYIAQGVNVIVIFADHGAALGPTVREAKEAGIQVVLHNGTEVGTAGTDYLTNSPRTSASSARRS